MKRTKLMMNWRKGETGEKYFYKNNAMQSRRSGDAIAQERGEPGIQLLLCCYFCQFIYQFLLFATTSCRETK